MAIKDLIFLKQRASAVTIGGWEARFSSIQPNGNLVTTKGVMSQDGTFTLGIQPVNSADTVAIMLEAPNGDFVVATYGANGATISRLTSTGTQVWSKRFPSNYQGAGIAVDANGDVVFGTNDSSQYYAARDSTIGKLNGATGALLWAKTTLGTGDAARYPRVEVLGGDIYVWGERFANTNLVSVMFISKYSSTGTLLWDRKLQTGGTDTTSMRPYLSTTGHLYLCGQTTSAEAALYKLNASGTVVYSKGYALHPTDSVYATWGIAEDTSGNLFLTGPISQSSDSTSAIIKIDPSGNILNTAALTHIAGYTGLSENSKIGPDGNLYAAATDGKIFKIRADLTGPAEYKDSTDTVVATISAPPYPITVSNITVSNAALSDTVQVSSIALTNDTAIAVAPQTVSLYTVASGSYA